MKEPVILDKLYIEHGSFLTVKDLVKILKVSRYVVDRLLKIGQIPAVKLGGQYRVRTDDFIKWWDCQVKEEQRTVLKRFLKEGKPFFK